MINAGINYISGTDPANKIYDYSSISNGNSGKAVTIYNSGAGTINSMSLIIYFQGTLSNLILTYISHPITTTSNANPSLTTGYNTYVGSTTQPGGFTIFDSTNNKNNLASLNPVAFFGFNQFKLSAGATVDI